MLRRIILAVMGVSMWLASSAQLAVGSWKQYPVFGEFSGLVDTGECVWYLTGGCLYRYDKDADETRFYEGGKDLSGFTPKPDIAGPAIGAIIAAVAWKALSTRRADVQSDMEL